MKRALLMGAAAVACLALSACLSGCASTSTTKLLDNLQGCERHYDGAVAGSLTGGSFSGTIKVDCKPGQGVAQVPAVAPTPPPGGV